MTMILEDERFKQLLGYAKALAKVRNEPRLSRSSLVDALAIWAGKNASMATDLRIDAKWVERRSALVGNQLDIQPVADKMQVDRELDELLDKWKTLPQAVDELVGGIKREGDGRDKLKVVVAASRKLHEDFPGQSLMIDRIVRERLESGSENGSPGAFFLVAGSGSGTAVEVIQSLLQLVDGRQRNIGTFDMSGYATQYDVGNLKGHEKVYQGAQVGLLTKLLQESPDALIVFENIEFAHTTTQNLVAQIATSRSYFDQNLGAQISCESAWIVVSTSSVDHLCDENLLQEPAVNVDRLLRDALAQATREGEGLGNGIAGPMLSAAARATILPVLPSTAGATMRILASALEGAAAASRKSLQVAVLEADYDQLARIRLYADGLETPIEVQKPGACTWLSSEIFRAVTQQAGDISEILIKTPPISPPSEGGWTFKVGVFAEDGALDVLRDAVEKLDQCEVKFISIFPSNAAQCAGAAQSMGEFGLVILDARGLSETSLEEFRDHASRLATTNRGFAAFVIASTTQTGEMPSALLAISERHIGRQPWVRTDVPGLDPELVTGVVEAYRDEALSQRLRRASLRLAFETRVRNISAEKIEISIERQRWERYVDLKARDFGFVFDVPQQRFSDLVGLELIQERLTEITGWIRNPDRFRAAKALPPRGVILFGPPGTGKTSLARALASEAGTPFFAMSGSELMSRPNAVVAVRDAFAKARRYAPSVMFIDEIDSIGAARGGGGGAAMILNELLNQIDGFSGGSREVFVIGATNRPDILDPALVRAGRLELMLEVGLPNRDARDSLFRSILKSLDVDDEILAEAGWGDLSTGLSGADIRQICNEAMLRALRNGRTKMTRKDLEAALDDLLYGHVTGNRPMSPELTRMVAFHEAGHAIAQYCLIPEEPIHIITVLPRGDALGFVSSTPSDEQKRLNTLDYLESRIKVLLAGRAAEELFLEGKRTAGVYSDLKAASALAMHLLAHVGYDQQMLIGNLETISKSSGGATQLSSKIAEGAQQLLARHYEDVSALLAENQQQVRALVGLLMERNVIRGKDLDELMEGAK